MNDVLELSKGRLNLHKLLFDECGGRGFRDGETDDFPCFNGDEEDDVETLIENGVDGEEVSREERTGVGGEKS